MIKQLENKNQFVITTKKYNIFQSYTSLIAVYDKETEHLYLSDKWDYSQTTRKHLYIFILRYTHPKWESMLDYYKGNKRKSIQHYIDNVSDIHLTTENNLYNLEL